MTRIEMEAVINGGGVVLFNGRRYSTVDSLPTQEEIDAVYAGMDVGPVVVSVDAVGTSVEEIVSRLPADFDADGGMKVHLQNPGDIAGGGGGGGGLTDVELRAAPVPVSGFPAVQPVSDNGGSLSVDDGGGSITVDGPLTDTQMRASAVPVSGPLTDTQLRAASVPVSGPLTDTQLRASAVPTSNSNIGTSTDAEATGDGTLIAISKRLRTLLNGITTLFGAGLPAALGSSGGVKVDVLSGGGGLSMGAAVEALASASRTATVSTSDITNTGYKGITVYFSYTAGTPNNVTLVQLEEKHPVTGLYTTVAQSAVQANNTLNQFGKIVAYPGATVVASTFAGQTVSAFCPRTFRITLFYQSATAVTAQVYYVLMP